MAATLSQVKNCWLPHHVAGADAVDLPEIPLITANDLGAEASGIWLWDMWAAQLIDGSTATFDGWVMWFVLTAPTQSNPIERHKEARIRIYMQKGDEWVDQGNLWDDGFCPGKREWAGSALYDPDASALQVFWTAAGRREDNFFSFEQRMFTARANVDVKGGECTFSDWSEPEEFLANDGRYYAVADQVTGAPGEILGWRDPSFFQDPADGALYCVFTASFKDSKETHSGVIGIARKTDGDDHKWELLPHLISADGLNNELERPHILFRDGSYYLFWSTQRHVFATQEASGPSGLYGMVASSLFGPYQPLNGTGLVAPNPACEPTQGFSWWVAGELEVASFVDYWGMQGATLDEKPERVLSHFGGVPAPRFKIALDGESAKVVP